MRLDSFEWSAAEVRGHANRVDHIAKLADEHLRIAAARRVDFVTASLQGKSKLITNKARTAENSEHQPMADSTG